MVNGAYAKIPGKILDDYRIASLPDNQWRAFILRIISENTHYESTSPARLEWMRVSKKMRLAVLLRDGEFCRECGSTTKLEADHIKPLARGGTNDMDNLQILCRTCNAKKWAHYG